MTRTRAAIRFAIGWLCFVPAWMAWGAATYGGLYRWLGDWQLASVGEYDGLLTFLFPTLLLMMPAFLFLRFRLGKMPAAPPHPVDPVRAEKLVMRVMGIVGLGGALVCAGALLWARHLPDRAGPSVDVDLATLGSAAPPLGRVTLIGTIDADHVVKRTIDAKGIGGRDLFAAMTIPGAAGAPARIFVEEYGGDAMTQPLPTDADNRFKGVLVEGGLPGTALRQLTRLGVPVASPYYVLLTGPEGARGNWYVLAGLSGFVALLGLLPVIGVIVARARRRRSG